MDLWMEFEEKRKLKEQEEDSLYKFKTKVFDLDESEDEQQKREVDELFTNFDEYYTSDTPTEAGDKPKIKSNVFQIADEDLNHLCTVHHFVVSCSSNALQTVATLHQEMPTLNDKVTCLKTMIIGYNLATDLVKHGDWSGMQVPIRFLPLSLCLCSQMKFRIIVMFSTFQNDMQNIL